MRLGEPKQHAAGTVWRKRLDCPSRGQTFSTPAARRLTHEEDFAWNCRVWTYGRSPLLRGKPRFHQWQRRGGGGAGGNFFLRRRLGQRRQEWTWRDRGHRWQLGHGRHVDNRRASRYRRQLGGRWRTGNRWSARNGRWLGHGRRGGNRWAPRVGREFDRRIWRYPRRQCARRQPGRHRFHRRTRW